ncbi:bidirectional sugar transporter SWEET6a-like [Nicotiana tabacum]|uniref:Bidirectional sugar transporter SWEET n=2 Tax=Nicotiana TaxID=4085 RepID=A0A1S4C6H5_TOBAC|nr:PREDICTED: bidirectional sugar transporter SWEET6a-like [Nicotiana sylvestris]XP_016496676.1 PREDICTED: bidirectional sugar transporter SWEET6a-like [Nicotiana tabacum]
MAMSTDQIRFIVGILGNFLSFFLFASPIPTFWRIFKNKSVEEFHPWPYIASTMNCMMWIFYGMPFVHPHSPLVVSINSVGLFLQLCYLSIFFCYAGKQNRKIIVGMLFVEIVGLAAIVVGTMLGLHTTANRTMIVGIICTIFGICMYGAPLSVMFKVIRTKSAEFLPTWLSVACFLNGICWAGYALLKFDPYILTGNGIGALLGLIQLLLLFIYRNPKKEDEKQATVELAYNV